MKQVVATRIFILKIHFLVSFVSQQGHFPSEIMHAGGSKKREIQLAEVFPRNSSFQGIWGHATFTKKSFSYTRYNPRNQSLLCIFLSSPIWLWSEAIFSTEKKNYFGNCFSFFFSPKVSPKGMRFSSLFPMRAWFSMSKLQGRNMSPFFIASCV